MTDLFLIKAPWSNKDFSFLKDLKKGLKRSLIVFCSDPSVTSEIQEVGLECFNPLSSGRILGESLPDQEFLIVIVEWASLFGVIYDEFRFFILSCGMPCLLLQSHDFLREVRYLKTWCEGNNFNILWEEECPFPSMNTSLMVNNLYFFASYLSSWQRRLLLWLLLGHREASLLKSDSENQNRGNRRETGSFSRKTRDCDTYVEKWSQRFRAFLRWPRWRQKAQSINARVRLYDAGRNISLKNENRAA